MSSPAIPHLDCHHRYPSPALASLPAVNISPQLPALQTSLMPTAIADLAHHRSSPSPSLIPTNIAHLDPHPMARPPSPISTPIAHLEFHRRHPSLPKSPITHHPSNITHHYPHP
jgi:hypothetical protein